MPITSADHGKVQNLGRDYNAAVRRCMNRE